MAIPGQSRLRRIRGELRYGATSGRQAPVGRHIAWKETGTLLRCVGKDRGDRASSNTDRAASASYTNHPLSADRSFLARAGERREPVQSSVHLHDSGVREHAGPDCREFPGDLSAAGGGPAGGRRPHPTRGWNELLVAAEMKRLLLSVGRLCIRGKPKLPNAARGAPI